MKLSVNFIETYFTEEKIQILFVIMLGLIAIGLASFFLFIIKYSFFKGMAIPLLLFGILQVIVGFNIYNRTPKDILRVESFYNQEPKKIKTEEIPRMEKIIHNFSNCKWIEIILIVAGIIIWLSFKNSTQTFWKGLALGLIIQASIMLTLDLIAANRAKYYIVELNLFLS